MAEAAAGAAPQRRSRLHDRLAGWWSHWLGRHPPLMDDPAPGRLDRSPWWLIPGMASLPVPPKSGIKR